MIFLKKTTLLCIKFYSQSQVLLYLEIEKRGAINVQCTENTDMIFLIRASKLILCILLYNAFISCSITSI